MSENEELKKEVEELRKILEDLKTVIAYEERKKNKTFEPIDFDDFLEEREKKYGVKF